MSTITLEVPTIKENQLSEYKTILSVFIREYSLKN